MRDSKANSESKMFDDLKSWTIEFVKHKDILIRNLVAFSIKEDFIEFNFKDKKHIYIIKDVLDESVKNKVKEGFYSIVCLNKRENIDFLAKNWNFFVKFSKLNLIFVNLKTNERWIICPSTHNKITEKEALKSGLNSMFESITVVK